ncbi:MAG: phosphatidate cytidylyltransferase [Dehalococcoidia bacterium]|nr:MAG: phosphatidate cytidylyltransferase [Dehalococcoidia bacterium]
MIAKRIITGILIGIVAGVAMWLGGPVFTVVAALVAAISAYEYYVIVKSEHIQPLTYFGIVFSILLVLNANCPPNITLITLPLIIILATIIPLIWMIFRHNKDNSFINWSWTFSGIIYTGLLISFYVYMRALDNGMGWVFLVIGSTTFCDIFAYAIGSKIGKHSLAASVSPGKTWEGSAGGLAGSIIFAIIASVFFNLPLNYWQMIIAGIIIAVFAQLGDLVESLLKRNMKTKDTGNILPGHGGVLDRIDSHLLTAPVAYYLIVLAINQGWLSS